MPPGAGRLVRGRVPRRGRRAGPPASLTVIDGFQPPLAPGGRAIPPTGSARVTVPERYGMTRSVRTEAVVRAGRLPDVRPARRSADRRIRVSETTWGTVGRAPGFHPLQH